MIRALLLTALILLAACDNSTPIPEPVSVQTDFSQGTGGWTALFTNYPRGEEAFYEIREGIRLLPPPLSDRGTGFFLSAFNHSDDINMHLVRQVNGLVPGATYAVEFSVTFATNVPSGCVGVGGAPGEGVTVHAAASGKEPALIADEYTLNLVEAYEVVGEFDSWYRAFGLGDIANGQDCEEVEGNGTYELKTLTSTPTHSVVAANRSGRVWLLVGTRSGFEARTDLYYTRIETVLRPG